MPVDPAEEWHLTEPAEGPSPHAVLAGWEKLRLLYNAILIPWVVLNVLAGVPGATGDSPLWGGIFLAGFVANVCFCLGPVAEAYLVWLFGADPRAARVGVFVLGTGFTALAAAALIWSLPNQN